MAINPEEYTISYSQLMKNTTIRDRMNMAQSDNTFFNQLLRTLTPTQMANLFPRYYREKLPDISGFQLATSQIAAGKFGEGLPSSPITAEAPSQVSGPRKKKTREEIEKDAKLTGEVDREKKRKSLPKEVSDAFDDITTKNKARSFSAKDDPFANLTDAELKSAGLKRTTLGKEGGNVYTRDRMSAEQAKQQILNRYNSGDKDVTGFKFDNPTVETPGWLSKTAYYKKYGVGMGNKDDNARIQTEIANYIAKKGKEAGYTDAAIKGMIANGYAESQLGLMPYGDNGSSGGVFHLNKGGAGNSKLLTKFFKSNTDVNRFFTNKETGTVDEYIQAQKDSIDFSFDLFAKHYPSMHEKFKTIDDVNAATDLFFTDFENPADQSEKKKQARRDIAARDEIANAVLEEVSNSGAVPEFVKKLQNMDGSPEFVETGPGGMGKGVDIIQYAMDNMSEDELLKFKDNLVDTLHEKGLTDSDSTAEQVSSLPSGSFIKGYDPSEDYSLPGKGNATSKYAEENFMPAMNFIGGLGLGKAIGENPYVRQGVFNPEGTETITGHSPRGHHRGAHGALAADISSGTVARPKWVKHVGSQSASLEINQALGDLMFNDKMVGLLKPTELINQGRRVASSSGWRLSPKGHGHPNHVHFAPSRNVTAETYDQVRQILFTNPEYFGDEGKRFADTMVKHGLWSETENGYELSRDKYAEFYEQKKEEEVKAEVQPETSAEAVQDETEKSAEYQAYQAKRAASRQQIREELAGQEYTEEDLKRLSSSARKAWIKRQNELKSKGVDHTRDEEYLKLMDTSQVYSNMLIDKYVEKYADLSDEDLQARMTNAKKGEDISPYWSVLERREEERNKANSRSLSENESETTGKLYDDRVPEGKNDSPLANSVVTNVESESIVTPMGMYEGGIINAKDNLKVVREDGSPTGIRVASDETAVIIPPDERRKARDIVSLDGTDRRDGLGTMDEDATNIQPAETPSNQARMASSSYSPSNQATVASSLGSIDYSPSAMRAYVRDKYFDNHGYHSAPRTIYAQK
jgi:hypothetical protein